MGRVDLFNDRGRFGEHIGHSVVLSAHRHAHNCWRSQNRLRTENARRQCRMFVGNILGPIINEPLAQVAWARLSNDPARPSPLNIALDRQQYRQNWVVVFVVKYRR